MLIHIHLVLIPVILLLAGVFAASEVSLLSLGRAQLETLRQQRPALFKRIRRLVYRPESLLATLIIGNEVLSILLGTLVTEYLDVNFTDTHIGTKVVLSVLVSSALLLLFSEVLPKVLAFRIPLPFAVILAGPVSAAQWILTPVRAIFEFTSRFVLNRFGLKLGAPATVDEQDFLSLVEVGAESGSLDADEKERIFNVFHFSDLNVLSVMTVWDQVKWVYEDEPLPEILKLVRETRLSRIPILSRKTREVIGILHAKELLKPLVGEGAPMLQRFPPYIVPAHKKVAQLFREFKLKKIHMALVVNEYGKQMGLVTLEDLLNALLRTHQKRKETT